MTHINHEEHMQHCFDSYCKKILKYKAVDIHREAKKRSKKEIIFSDMPTHELENISVVDKYFANEFVFHILGKNIGISDVDLGNALNVLAPRKREIVLFAYVLDMTDKEIAAHLKMARRTVAYQRTSTLRELRKLLGSED
jgi:DNA-directed RNA polymerase specialized sigma24 family protein